MSVRLLEAQADMALHKAHWYLVRSKHSETRDLQSDLWQELYEVALREHELLKELAEDELFGGASERQQEDEGLFGVGVTTICSGESITDCNGSGKAG
jgi:hypothetical protein